MQEIFYTNLGICWSLALSLSPMPNAIIHVSINSRNSKLSNGVE